MKKYSIVFTAVLALLYISLSSDIDGAAHHGHGDVTGAPTGVTGRCQTSSCHGGNNALNIVQLQILDSSTLLPITTYHSGKTYIVSLTGDATAVSTNLPGFGFMVSAVNGLHKLSGTYTIPAALSGSIHSYPCGVTTVGEHSVTLRQTVLGTNTYGIRFYWTAPAPFSDSVTFYSLLNATNGNGGSSGDYPNAAARVTIYEDPIDQLAIPVIHESAITLYPNPVVNQLNITSAHKIISLNITNISGKQVYSISGNSENMTVPTAGWPAGIYYVRINNTEVKSFVKQ